MRKVLVCGAAFAATCVSAVALPTASQATTPQPTPSLSGSAPVTPPPVPTEEPAEPGPSTGPPGSGSPGPSGPETPSPSTSAPPPATGSATGGVVSGRAVMVTPRPPKQASYAYGPAARQRIDAYWRPAAAKAKGAKTTGAATAAGKAKAAVKPGPAVLVLHGGYWLEGDKGGWKYFARRLSAQGFTVFAANYRLATMAQWPAQRNDAEAALSFIKKHAGHWNIDPDNIVVVGSSAGGHLATQLGTYGTAGQRVRGVVALSPVNTPYLAFQEGLKTSATGGQRKLRRAVTQLIRCTPIEADPTCWKRVDDANSASHASAGDAPMLLMHSTGDFVPVTQSTGLAAALRGAGVPATVKTVPGKMHGPALMNDEHVYPEILAWLKARTKPR
ncbi:alpha/beta hydrolase [Spirillospora sp. NBC_01491]|uniref:alpha/beta hydrolase n=1 Tax=Spirillospora sp. NBC_01491 TaxID=2976007 RepID=UPI002E36BE60|nr:alpha/beta hydrolase [Spirillospora sp. NBC_01491]